MAVLLFLMVWPISTIIYGAALAKLWEWFISDTFGVIEISTLQAIGLSLVVSLLTGSDTGDKSPGEILAFGLVKVVIAMLIGLVVVSFLR